METAKHPLVPTRSPDPEPLLQAAVAYNKPSQLIPFQSALMLLIGHFMEVASSATVLPTLTTPSWPSDLMLQETGTSETHGEPVGERKVSLLSRPETLVVFSITLLLPID